MTRSNSHGGLRFGPLAAVAVLLLACAAAQVQTDLRVVRGGSENVAGEEMNVTWALERVAAGAPLYTDPARPPYAVIQYGPVYYRVVAGLLAAAGVRPGEPDRVVAVARGVSLACLIGQAVIAGVILRRHLRAGWDLVAIAGATLVVVQGEWGVAGRPDAMEVAAAALAALLGLEAVAAAREEGGGARGVVLLALALATAALAGLVKQNGLEAAAYVLPGAALALGVRRTAAALALGAGLAAALAVAAFAGMGTVADVRANLVGGLNNGIHPLAALHLTYAPYLKTSAPLAAAGLLAGAAPFAALARAWSGGGGDRASSLSLPTPAALLVGWSALASFGVATLSALKFGSAPNYYLLFNLFALVAIAGFLEGRRSSDPASDPSGWAWLAAAVLALMVPARAFEARITYPTLGAPYAEAAGVAARLRAALDEAPEGSLFFSTDTRLDAFLPDRCAAPMKLIAALQHRRGVIPFDDFARAAADGTIRFLVLDGPDRDDPAAALRHFSLSQHGTDPGPGPAGAAFLGARFDAFRPLFRSGGHTVYVSPSARPNP